MAGEDSLHEMAYGEPIERQAVAERLLRLVNDPSAKAELDWLSTIEPIDGKLP